MSHKTLHIVNAENNLLTSVVEKGDGIVFIENGIYFARSIDLHQFDTSVKCYVLAADLNARGFQSVEGTSLLSYEGLVDLCSESVKVVSW